jgi:hypothetical protein
VEQDAAVDGFQIASANWKTLSRRANDRSLPKMWDAEPGDSAAPARDHHLQRLPMEFRPD